MRSLPAISSAEWFPASPFDAIVIGCSSGGLKALTLLLAGLPAFFPAPIIVVQHRFERRGLDLLPLILSRHTSLSVKAASEGERLKAGRVYVAPAGRHVLISPDRTLVLSASAKINHSRPSIDALFYSAALNCGRRALAIILTGCGSDGAKGVSAMKQFGAMIVVQDKNSSHQFAMPAAALATGAVSLCLPIEQIPRALIALAMVPGARELFWTPPPTGGPLDRAEFN